MVKKLPSIWLCKLAVRIFLLSSCNMFIEKRNSEITFSDLNILNQEFFNKEELDRSNAAIGIGTSIREERLEFERNW